MKKIATHPLDRVALSHINKFVEIMSDLALKGGVVQPNSYITLAIFNFQQDILGFNKKGGRFFKNHTPEELAKLTAFVDKLGSVVTG